MRNYLSATGVGGAGIIVVGTCSAYWVGQCARGYSFCSGNSCAGMRCNDHFCDAEFCPEASCGRGGYRTQLGAGSIEPATSLMSAPSFANNADLRRAMANNLALQTFDDLGNDND
jgi:hypothetical protein